MFIERHAEGNYKTKHAETRLGSTILPYTYTYTNTHADTETHNEDKEGRLSADTFASFISVPLVHGHAKWQVAGHIGMSARNAGGAYSLSILEIFSSREEKIFLEICFYFVLLLPTHGSIPHKI